MITMFHGYDISLYVQQHGPGVYKHLFARGDLFTCPSEFVRKRLITAGCPAEKVQRFKLGTDLQRFSFKERTLDSSGAIRLVTVARLTEKKGLEYSIRAVAKLSQRFAKLEYNIIGDGDLRPELTQLIEALGVGSTVHLLGWKTQEEVQVLLDQSHVFVLASGPIGAWTAVALQAVCRRLVASPLGTRVSERTAKQFPLGYFMTARRLGALQAV